MVPVLVRARGLAEAPESRRAPVQVQVPELSATLKWVKLLARVPEPVRVLVR